MLMNKVEVFLMNNPIRRLIQSTLEVKRMKKLSELPGGMPLVLEIGCGSGHGTRLIKKHFLPEQIEAIDLDPKMIAVAKKRNRDALVSFNVGDAAKLDFKTSTFDAIFDFGIIHHIPNWHDCIKELYRVLKPGGYLILEDLSIETFSTPFGKFLRKILVHPYKEMFKRDEFITYLKKTGFKINKQVSYNPLGLIPYFVVIAKKPAQA